MSKINLKAFNAYKVKVVVTGNGQTTNISRLKYETGQEVYVLGKEQLEMIIKSNVNYEPKIVKAIECVAQRISEGNQGK